MLVVWAGMLVVHSSAVTSLDSHISTTVVAHRSPSLNALMKVATWMGSWVALLAATVLLIVLAWTGRVPLTWLVIAIIAWAGESLCVALAKQIVQRPRPPPDLRLVTAHGWSWPSGHAAAATLIYGTLALTLRHVGAKGILQAAAWIIAGVAVATVAFSRVELGVHWMSDVVSGIVFVSVWLWITTRLFRKLVLSPELPSCPSCVEYLAF